MALITFFYNMFLSLEVDAESSSPDFSALVKENKWFVDKSMLIKDFLHDTSSVKIITVPNKFGKSTVIDMIRRFTEIKMDSYGQQILPNATENYKLFCDPPLKVCRDITFVDKHLGQYPVIHLTYEPLKSVKNYKSLLRTFRIIVLEAFSKHQYLAQSSEIFPTSTDLDLFMKHYSRPVKKLSEEIVTNSLKWLSKLLYMYFGKAVIILLDDYDMVHRNYIQKQVNQLDQVIKFLDDVNDRLLKNNRYMDRAFLSGIIRIQVGAQISKNSFQECRFLGNHLYSRYFGFTDREIDELVLKSQTESSEVTDTKRLLKEMYSGYLIENQNTTIYCMWSVIQCLSHQNTFDSFWVDSQRLLFLLHIFTSDVKLNAIRELLFGKAYSYKDISSFLTKDTMISLKGTVSEIKPKTDEDEITWLYSYLYDMGYLTSMCIEKREKNLVPLRIPNDEIFFDFCSTLSDLYKHDSNKPNDDDITRLNDLINYKISVL